MGKNNAGWWASGQIPEYAFFDGIELSKVSKLEEEFLQHVNSKCKNVLDELSNGILKDSSLKVLEDVAKRISNNYK